MMMSLTLALESNSTSTAINLSIARPPKPQSLQTTTQKPVSAPAAQRPKKISTKS